MQIRVGREVEKLAIKISTVSRINLAVCFCILPSHAKKKKQHLFVFVFFSGDVCDERRAAAFGESEPFLAFWGSRSK